MQEQELNILEAIIAQEIKAEPIDLQNQQKSNNSDKTTQTDDEIHANFVFEISPEEFSNLSTEKQDFLIEFMEIFNIKDSKNTQDILKRLEARKNLWNGFKYYKKNKPLIKDITYGLPHFGSK